ncbi:MAG: restriction endonuclease [Desulfuromonadales bacterium]|nr:restriction endonuclease [Desulfuromonadales bacterium]
MKNKTFNDCQHISLSEWLQLLKNPPRNSEFVDYQFPIDQHRDEYIQTIHERTEMEVLELVKHFLIPSTGLGVDRYILKDYIQAARTDPDRFQRMSEREFIKRLLKSVGQKNSPAWEGITWVLDLLPHFPKKALEGLSSYLMAHAQWLPDGRFMGLSDAGTLIRAKFIGVPAGVKDKLDFLLCLDSREFECVIERLYDALEYETELTPPRSDGGRDVIARQTAPGRKESILIECKKYAKSVGVEYARRLLGVVSSDKATKGVIVSTADFTRGAQDFARINPRIELVSGTELIVLMNEHLGPTWPVHIERLIAECLRNQSNASKQNYNVSDSQCVR